MVDFYISKNLLKNDGIVLAKMKEGIAKSHGDAAVNNLKSQQTDNFTKTINKSDDDGKISFKEKIINFGKGIIKPIKTIFSSPKNIAITAVSAAAAAGLIFITSGAAAPIMVAAGLLGGVCQIGKGIYKQAKAKTDDEAKNAWQDMGSGTFAVGVSALGAKSALKASGVSNTKDLSLFKSIIECVKRSSPSNIVKAFKTASGKISSSFTHIKSSENTKLNNVSLTNKKTQQTSAAPSSENSVPSKAEEVIMSSKETNVPPKTAGTAVSSSGNPVPSKAEEVIMSSNKTNVPPKTAGTAVSSSGNPVPQKAEEVIISSKETNVPSKTAGTVETAQLNEAVDTSKSQNVTTPKYIRKVSIENNDNVQTSAEKLSILDKIKNFFKLFGLGLKD